MTERNLHVLALCYRILGVLVALQAFLTFESVLRLYNPRYPFPFFPGQVVLELLNAFPLGPLLSWSVLVLTVIAAFALFAVAGSLRRPERRTFCLLVAWLVTAYLPLGTVLGVFTIVHLLQSDIYKRVEAPTNDNQPPAL